MRADTMTLSQGGNFSFGKLLMFVLIVVAIGLACHAVLKHGPDAEAVYNCMNSNGPMQVWQKPDGRKMYVCQVDTNVFGIYITEADGSEVTAFIKNKLRTLEQVIQYLRNCGAQPIQ